MATTVDTLLVRIEADMSDIKRDLNNLQKDTLRSTTAAGASFKKLGTIVNAAAVGVIAIAAARAGKAMIDMAGDVAEMQSKSSVVFGQFRDQVVSDLSAFGAEVGRSSHELEGMASSIQDTFVPMGFARGEAAKLSVDLTKLAVDVASFNNASDAETMQAFQSALVGNHETVRRFGVVITEATLKQELLRMGITRTGDAVTNAEKVQARLNLILAGTTDAQGDAARTADSYANQVKALTAEFETLAVDIGNELLPAATDLVELFRDGLVHIKSFLVFVGALPEFGRNAEGVTKQIAKLNSEIRDLEDVKAGRADDNVLQRLGKSFLEGGVSLDEQIAMKQRLVDAREAELKTLMAAAQAEAAAALEKEKAAAAANTQEVASTELTNTLKKLEEKTLQTKFELAGYTKEQVKALQSSGLLADAQGDLQIVQIALTDGYDKIIKAVDDYTTAQDALTKKEEEAEAKKKALAQAAETFAANQEKLKDLIKETIAPTTELEEQIAALELHLGGAGSKIEGAELALEKLRLELLMQDPVISAFTDGVNRMSDQLADALADAALDGKLSLEDLGDAFKQTLREMIADAMKAQIIKPLLSSIFGGIGGAIGGPVGDFIGGIGQNATGGPVIKGAPYIVGERGPELFVPQGAGSVVNAATTRGLGGGSGTVINQNFNVSTGVQQTVRNEIRQLMPQIADNTRAAVADAKRRGGSYGKAFG